MSKMVALTVLAVALTGTAAYAQTKPAPAEGQTTPPAPMNMAAPSGDAAKDGMVKKSTKKSAKKSKAKAATPPAQ